MIETQSLALIVEDDASTREFVVRGLARKGIEAIEASTVGEALVRLGHEPLPSLLILDLMLPDANGTVLLRRIRRSHLPIRVAVLTGVSDLDTFSDLSRFPPDRIFKKPVDLRKLLAWVKECESDHDA